MKPEDAPKKHRLEKWQTTAIAATDECIYCGATENLSDEHSIPLSLNGPWIIENGSCKGICHKITSAFEREVARNQLLAFRIAINSKTRRPKRRPSELPLTLILAGGKTKVIELPADQHPATAVFQTYAPPGIIQGREPSDTITATGYHSGTIRLPKLEEQLKKHGATGIRIKHIIDPSAFLRLVGKIAYCHAVAEFGLAGMRHLPILESILGNDNLISHWVGSAREQPPPNPTNSHHVSIGTSGDYLVANVVLFANFNGHAYEVVLGKRPSA